MAGELLRDIVTDGAAQGGDPLDIRPPWLLKKRDNHSLGKWVMETTESLIKYYTEDVQKMRQNLAWYAGDWEKAISYMLISPTGNKIRIPKSVVPKAINHLWRITEEHVAHMSRFRPVIQTVPHDTEASDAAAARLGKSIIDQTFSNNNYPKIQETIDRWVKIFGEAYVSVSFDKDKGARRRTAKGDLVIDKKTKVTKKIGDVSMKLVEPFYVFPFPALTWEDVPGYLQMEEFMHVDQIRLEFGEEIYRKVIGQKTEAGGISSFLSGESFLSVPADHLPVIKVVFKPNKWMEEGLVLRVIEGVVVQKFDGYPYAEDELDLIRITDIDLPGKLRGTSYYSHLIPIQHEYNKMTSLLLRNLYFVAHPKIFIPEGAASSEDMTNGLTTVKYRGGIKPEIAVFRASPPELYNFRDTIREEMGQLGASHGVSRGEPPPGIRAGIALQFLEEQERELRSTAIRKKNDFIRVVAKRVLSTAGIYYKVEDDRIVRLVGSNHQFDTEILKTTTFSDNSDVVIQNTSALGESVAGKTARLIELRNIFGNTFITDEIAADVLEFGQFEKVFDVKTAAIRAAQAENEQMLKGKGVESPERYEDLFAHWKQHLIMVQSRSFKKDASPEVKASVLGHGEETEYLMQLKGKQNAFFFQKLQNTPEFPAFLQEEVVPPPPTPVDPANPVGRPQGQTLQADALAQGVEVNGDGILEDQVRKG